MNCPNCHNRCRETDSFCRMCGTALNHADAPKRGSLLIPAVILVAIVLCGLIGFFATTTAGPFTPVQQDFGISSSSTAEKLSFFSIMPEL